MSNLIIIKKKHLEKYGNLSNEICSQETYERGMESVSLHFSLPLFSIMHIEYNG